MDIFFGVNTDIFFGVDAFFILPYPILYKLCRVGKTSPIYPYHQNIIRFWPWGVVNNYLLWQSPELRLLLLVMPCLRAYFFKTLNKTYFINCYIRSTPFFTLRYAVCLNSYIVNLTFTFYVVFKFLKKQFFPILCGFLDVFFVICKIDVFKLQYIFIV